MVNMTSFLGQRQLMLKLSCISRKAYSLYWIKNVLLGTGTKGTIQCSSLKLTPPSSLRAPLYSAVLIGPLLLTSSATPHLPKGQTPPGGSYSPSWLRGAHDVDVASVSVQIGTLGEDGRANLPRCGQMPNLLLTLTQTITHKKSFFHNNSPHHAVIQRPL